MPDRPAPGLLTRLRRAWEMEHLAPWPTGSPEDEAAFLHWTRELTANYTLLATSFMLFAILLWWVADTMVLPDYRHMQVFAELRLRAAAVMSLAVLALGMSNAARRQALVIAPLLSLLVCAIIGWTIGGLGPESVVWYANALIAPIPSAMVPVALGWRALSTAPACFALAGTWLLRAPGNLQSAFTPSQLSFTLFIWLFTMIMGELFYRTVRRSFFQQRAIDRTRRDVARINSSLAERVDAQTRELRQLAHRLQHAQESERRHLSRELHDELGQDLTAIRLTLSLLDQRFAFDPTSLGPLLAQVRQLVTRATATTRSIVEGLRPKVVEDLGLVAGAHWLCRTLQESSGVPCELSAPPGCDAGLDTDQAIALFRVLQESMNNALKHSQASRLIVEITAQDLTLTVTITDDGVGFDPDQPARGLGMIGMRERVRACGGRLDVRSAPGQGSSVQATVPTRTDGVTTGDGEETPRVPAHLHRG